MLWRFSRAAVIFGLLPALAATKSGIIQVTGVRAWSHADSTRVVIETSGPFEYKADRAYNPERLFLDISHARPWIAQRRFATREVDDKLVRRVRIAESAPNVTRIVFDLKAQADYKITSLDSPDRLVVELRPLRSPTPAEITYKVSVDPPAGIAAAQRSRERSESDHKAFAVATHRFIYPPLPRRAQIVMAGAPPVIPDYADMGTVNLTEYPTFAVRPRQSRSTPALPALTPALAISPAAPSTQVITAAKSLPTGADGTPLASENASRSLTRALGLKVSRIVIDAGHGGHDDGTIGPHGVLEKDVVLDVALRVSRLIQERMGAEVVLTRSDDTFIPLRERTAIANDRKADLFLSIHANSSPAPEVAGTETFYLNFTNQSGSLDVAARENAGSDKTVGELKDLIQSITLNDKIEESHTFAEDIQNSIQAQAERSNAAAHNRGVKRAPFVVLIGASMPSVLAEIGFLSNNRDENNLAKPEYRQKIAEALYKGLAQYSRSLSHFDPPKQVAKSNLSHSGAP